MVEYRKRITVRIVSILNDRGLTHNLEDLPDDAPLYGPMGVGLDSLDMAVLSTVLEQDWGRDPFSRGLFPRTLGELIAFYEQPA